jgi:hypothetical protein
MKKNAMLARQVEQMAATMAGSPFSAPRSGTRTAAITNLTGLAGTKRNLEEISFEAEAEGSNDDVVEAEGASDNVAVEDGEDTEQNVSTETVQQDSAAARSNALDLLNGLAESTADLSTITVMSEMERFWAANIFQNRKEMADRDNAPVPKRALFDTKNKYFFGYNPDCYNDTKGMKKGNLDAMTMVAIAFTSQQWNRLFEKDCQLDEMRSIVGLVVKQMQANLKACEIRFCDRSETSRFAELKNLRSISGKWITILKGLKKTMNFKDVKDIVFKEWLADKLGEPPGSVGQSSLHRFLG